MKLPSKMSKLCPRCGKHTPHSVSLHKKGKGRKMSWGERRHEREKHGYGGQKYPIQRKKAKATKKAALKLKCDVCGYIKIKKGIRLRKVTIGRGE